VRNMMSVASTDALHIVTIDGVIEMGNRSATLYRMVLPDHTCPFGVKAKELLEQHGFDVDDRVLRSRPEVDAFEAENQVQTAPQVFIGGQRVGGSDDLERYLAKA
jgi:glutaredoxin 3